MRNDYNLSSQNNICAPHPVSVANIPVLLEPIKVDVNDKSYETLTIIFG